MRILSPLKSPVLQRHLRENIDITYPEHFLHRKNSLTKQHLIGKDGYFRAAIDVTDFKADEVKVTAVGHTISVTGQHEEKEDSYGTVARNFNKKFVLPLDLDTEKISAWVSKDILYLKVPPKLEPTIERIVNIKLDDSKPEK